MIELRRVEEVLISLIEPEGGNVAGSEIGEFLNIEQPEF